MAKYKEKQPPTDKIRIVNDNRSCQKCGEKLNLRSTATRNLINLQQKIRLSVQVGYCMNENCEHYKVGIKPTNYLNQIVPESGYGIDVYGLIGTRRLTNRNTVLEIRNYLSLNYPHIEIGERHVENIVKDINLYIAESGKNAKQLKGYFDNRNQLSLYLSIDGLQPEQGHNILYIVREVLSGKILFAHYSTHSDEKSISEEILIPLKQTLTSAGLQVGGWIADKELALGKAIQQEFPQTPFQHCQSHFLAKMKAPLTEADTELGKTVKKNFGKLRPTERNITASAELGTINIEEAEQLQALCSTIRSWQSRSLSHKHRLKGVELYESMAQIADCIPSLRAEKDHSVLEELQIKLENSIAGLKTDYEALKQGKNVLDQLTDVLYGAKDEKGNRNTKDYKIEATGSEVEQEVGQVIEQSFEQYKTHSSQMRKYLLNFQNTYQNWKLNLFTCYDYPDIPNDNNRLELSHSQMKKQHRRITGQQSTAKYLKIHGEQAAFTLNFSQGVNTQQVLEQVIRQTDYKQFKEQKRKQQLKSKERGRMTTTKRGLHKTLAWLKQNWGKKSDSS